MNMKEIQELLSLMQEHKLTEVEIEKDGLKIKLRKGISGKDLIQEMVPQAAVLPVPAAATSAAPQAAVPAVEDPNQSAVKSPMVGTFYSAPTPDQPPYVQVGKQVKEGDVLCIVEAMKLMNEIKSEQAGTITEVLVSNGQPVEFDQPLFKIKKG